MRLTLLERSDSYSPGSAGFSQDGARAVQTYLLELGDDPDPDDVQAALTYFVGGTSQASSDGRITRTPPVAHPMFPFLYASSIPSMRGLGKFKQFNSIETLEVPPFPQYCVYPAYEIQVEFTPRPYAVTQDANISMQLGAWYDDDGNPFTFHYANEWVRYTDYELVPQFNNITVQQGTVKFDVAGGAQPNNFGFPGQSKMFLPDQILKFTWFNVPWRYITSPNSYITKWPGRINQNDWYNWKAGQLLYLSYSAKRFSPPEPELDWFSGVYSTEKLATLELTFQFTNRPLGAAPSAVSNQNYVQAHHNLLPWFSNRKFYYAKSEAGVPPWLSFPVELMFTDPDFSGAYQP